MYICFFHPLPPLQKKGKVIYLCCKEFIEIDFFLFMQVWVANVLDSLPLKTFNFFPLLLHFKYNYTGNKLPQSELENKTTTDVFPPLSLKKQPGFQLWLWRFNGGARGFELQRKSLQHLVKSRRIADRVCHLILAIDWIMTCQNTTSWALINTSKEERGTLALLKWHRSYQIFPKVLWTCRYETKS